MKARPKMLRFWVKIVYFGSFLSLRGPKNENFEKKNSDLKRASKITYKTYVTSLKKKIKKKHKICSDAGLRAKKSPLATLKWLFSH